jgi:hypothetical protein
MFPLVIRVTKYRTISGGYVARMEKLRNVYKNLVGYMKEKEDPG